MKLSGLSDDLYRLLHMYVVYGEPVSIATWKKQLVLLGVCQSMRQALYAQMYAQGYVDYYRPKVYPTGSYLFKPKDADLVPKIISNTDLMDNQHCKNNLTWLHIYSSDHHQSFSFSRAYSVLSQITSKMYGVTKLSISTDSDILKPYKGEKKRRRFPVSVANFHANMKTMLPNLKTIYVNGTLQLKLIREIYEYNDYYACETASPIKNDGRRFVVVNAVGGANGLTSLTADASRPKVNWLVLASAKTLQQLRLCRIPCKVEMSISGYSNSSKPVVFPCLKLLSIEHERQTFTPDYHAKPKTVLEFPQLKSFRLYAPNGYCSVLDAAKFPLAMDNIRVHGNNETLRLLDKADIREIVSMTFIPISEYSQGIEYNLYVRNIFSRQLLRTYGALEVCDQMNITPDELHELTITNLTYFSSVSPELVIELITKLPLLFEINIRCVNRLFVGSDNKDIVPFKAPISKLTMCYSKLATKPTAELLQYLALRLPRLTKVKSNCIDTAGFQKWAQAAATEHPHLQHVTYEPYTSNSRNFLALCDSE